MNSSSVDDVVDEIRSAYLKSREKHVPMMSPHEGYAIIKEEFDELWVEIKAWQPSPVLGGANFNEHISNSIRNDEYHANMRAMRKEALHVAAMALAFLLEVTP